MPVSDKKVGTYSVPIKEAATETATNAFKRFFEEGAGDPSTLEQWTGEVTYTF